MADEFVFKGNISVIERDGRFSLDLASTPDGLEKIADRIEQGRMPVSGLVLGLLCAALCRRVAKLERDATGV